MSVKCRIVDCDRTKMAKKLCNVHYLRKYRHGSTDLQPPKSQKLAEMGVHRCPSCKETKSVGSFYKDKHTFTGVAAYCKNCNKTKSSRYYSNNKDAHRNYWLKSKYNITLADYTQMYRKQKGRCAVCQDGGVQLVVDHDHDSKAVRGLLCSSCNFGLGIFKDSQKRLLGAIEYLQNTLKEVAS